jgi:hypothetical protein
MRLKDKSPRWKTAQERICYAGQEFRWLGETRDWKKQRLAQLLTGELAGSTIWVSEDSEIEPEDHDAAH